VRGSAVRALKIQFVYYISVLGTRKRESPDAWPLAELHNVWWKVPQKQFNKSLSTDRKGICFQLSSSLDSLFMVRSYGVGPHRRAAMDNHNQRNRALRVSMLEAEDIMRDQINRDEECSEIAGEIMVMRQCSLSSS